MGYTVPECLNCGNKFGLPKFKVGNKICCRECVDKETKKLHKKLSKIKLKDINLSDLINIFSRKGLI